MSGVSRALERRAARVADVQSMQAETAVQWGFIELVGVGEFAFEVDFPEPFLEIPHLGGGAGHLAEGEALVQGQFPTWNYGAAVWRYEQRPGGARVYTGALLAIVVTGTGPDMRSVLHWQATGKALTNPVDDFVSIDQDL